MKNNNSAEFSHYRQGNFYYNIHWISEEEAEDCMGVPNTYQFQVPDDDIGNCTLEREEKAITLMRWINRCIKEGTLIKI